MNPNETYTSRHRKYTINIPLAVFSELEAKSRVAGFEEVAPYLRMVMANDIKNGLLTKDDILGILGEKELKKQEWLIRNKDYCRREYIGNTKYSFIKIKIKKVFDIFNPRQYTLF